MKDLSTGNYEDPEAFAKKYTDHPKSILPSRGYFTKGDKSADVGKITSFFAEKTKGNLFGDYAESTVKVFQKNHNLTADGKIGAKTLEAMKKDGFKE